MLSQFKSIMLCATVATLASFSMQNQVVGQGCSTCGGAPTFGFPAHKGCGAGGCGSKGCGAGGCGLGDGHLRESIHEGLERSALIAARNDAWPKPFNCADRRVYENVWGKYIDAGYERQTVLSSTHFDSETGELNDFGRTIVSGLLQNMPESRKGLFVHRDGDADRSQQRMDNLREYIQYNYGQNTASRVAFSNELPMRGSGLRVERLQSLEFEATPVPIIPIASGTTSVTAGIGN